MTNVNKQIDAYLEKRNVKFHDIELLKLIQNDFPEFQGNFLDIGCAAGSFIEYISSFYPKANFTGIDISSRLIHLAKKKNVQAKSEFFLADAIAFEPQFGYDIITASGVLSIFDDFREPLNKWLSWLKYDGVLYLFGRFNSRDIDTIVHFRNNFNGSKEWEGGLTSYSIKTVSRFCESLGFSTFFERFYLPVVLKENENPIRTFSKEIVDGEIIVINGANIIAEQYFCRIKRK